MKKFKTHRLKVATARIVLAMAAIGTCTNGAAQFIVNDPIHTTLQTNEFIQTLARWGTTLAQYQREIAAYQQMIATVMNLNFQSLMPAAQLQKIEGESILTLIKQACPGAKDMSSIVSSILPLDLNGPIKENQDRICQNIVQLRTKSYNETVDMLSRLNQYQGLFKTIDDMRNSLMGSSSSQGDLQANTNEAVRNANKLQNEVSNWQARMNVYETAIKTLEGQQSILARVALRGSASWTGKAVQAATFAAAFSSH